MRSSNLLMCALCVVAVAIAAPTWAQVELPTSCTTENFSIAVSNPCMGDCAFAGTPLFCGSGTGCTGVTYTITGGSNPDHVATLVPEDATIVVPASSADISPPCEGDGVTGIGEYSCHEQAVRLNADADTTSFHLVVQGVAEPIPSSIVVKAGRKITEACMIAGLGTGTPYVLGSCVPSCGDYDPNQTIIKTEVLNFKGCRLEFQYSLETGEVTSVQLSLDSPPGCQLLDFPVDQLQITVPGSSGPATMGATFGDGFISAGTESCSCRVIGGRVYCWGSPCPTY